ncbi:MAG TPA: hypothetical protein VGE27_18180 [Gemmatimonas sp.]|uniref:hypothetical protein n=1 Tax=Gemmatimonas sp. TaxID=1962908 RepID=UPI002ED82E5F
MHDEQQNSTAGGKRSAQGSQQGSPGKTSSAYPLGRGYGHDYMRGGEVFGGYGYSARPEYEQTRGERSKESS